MGIKPTASMWREACQRRGCAKSAPREAEVGTHPTVSAKIASEVHVSFLSNVIRTNYIAVITGGYQEGCQITQLNHDLMWYPAGELAQVSKQILLVCSETNSTT